MSIPSTLLMLAFLSILILAHELGHFFVAKRCGVKVERFGLGLPMGPTLWSKQVGETTFCLHLVLFGGYVAFPDDSPDSPVPADSTQRFENQPLLNRAAIAVAGITVNAIMAIAIMWAVLMIWGAPIYKIYIDGFIPATQAVVAPALMQETLLPRLKEQNLKVAAVLLPENRVVSGYEGLNENLLAFKPLSAWQANNQLALIDTSLPEKTGSVLYTAAPALAAGLKVGDELVALEGEGVAERFDRSLMFVKQSIGEHAGKSLAITVAHAGTPEKAETLMVTPDNLGHIGIAMRPQEAGRVNLNLFKGLTVATDFLNGVVIDNFTSIGQLITGKLSPSLVSGPIGIVTQGAQIIEHSGLEKGLVLTAMISMILAVMNLLPIPPLDGSHLLFIAIEAIKGSPVNKKVQEGMIQIGFFGLMGLMVFVVLNDLYNLVAHPPLF